MIRELFTRLFGREETAVRQGAGLRKPSSTILRLQHGVAVALVDFDAKKTRLGTLQVSKRCPLQHRPQALTQV